ncbi:MAG: hypothetical protein ACRDSE_13525, partial [Pseudonocardiaceae bacterium]
PGDVATWYEAKAVLLAKIAGAGGTPDEKMLPLAAQARAARQHAAKVRAESPDLELRAHTGAGCLDHTAWGCPVLPESRIAAAA